MSLDAKRDAEQPEGEGKPGWWAKLNPLRIAMAIIVGVLAIYIAILWQRTDQLALEFRQGQAENTRMKAQIESIRIQLRSIERRLPVGQFEWKPSSPKPDAQK